MGILKKNVIATVSQVLVFALCQFVLYRLIIMQLGVEKLGLWSVITSFTMTASIGNFGASGSSIVMFVARYLAEDNREKVRKIVSTSLIFVTISVSVTLMILFPVAKFTLYKMLSPDYFEYTSQHLLYLSFVYFILYSVSFLLWSVIDGYQMYVRRVFFNSLAQILNLALSAILMIYYDLQGLFWALIIQYLFLTVAGLLIVYRLVRFRLVFCRESFREIFRYGIKLQGISLLSTFSEPIIKFFLTLTGGLAITGYYEMANKITNQIRSPLMVGLQTLIPAIAESNEDREEKISHYFKKSTVQILDLALMTSGLFIILLPLISRYWVGSLNETFIWMSVSLSLGYLLNTIASPINYINLGTAHLNGNVYQQLIQTISVVIFSLIFGFLFHSAKGMSVALGLSIAVAAVWMFYDFGRRYHLNITKAGILKPKKWFSLIFALVILLVLLINFQVEASFQYLAMTSITALVFIFLFFSDALKLLMLQILPFTLIKDHKS